MPFVERLKKTLFSKNGVIVVGMPKAGNHFIMSVLDAMGCDRAEDIFNFGEGGDGVISGMIFQVQCGRSSESGRSVQTGRSFELKWTVGDVNGRLWVKVRIRPFRPSSF